MADTNKNNPQQKSGQPGQPAKPANAPATADTKTPEERFKELAPKRTRGVLKSLEILSNCSNKSGYLYTPEQIEKIFEAITKKVAECKAKFSSTGAKKGVDFTL